MPQHTLTDEEYSALKALAYVNRGSRLLESTLNIPIDYNLPGAVASIPTGTFFTRQEEIDAFLLKSGTTHFKHVMDVWDALPNVLNKNVTLSPAAGVHRPRPGQATNSQNFPLINKTLIGGAQLIIQGATNSSWTPVSAALTALTVNSITAAPTPSMVFSGTPFQGLDLRGLHVVTSVGQVCMICDHTDNTLFTTANLSPTPVGGTATVMRPSTIFRNSLNDTTAYSTSGCLGIGVRGGTVQVNDLRIDSFSGASSGWGLITSGDEVRVSCSRVLQDYIEQFTAFGRSADGRAFQNGGRGGSLTLSLCGARNNTGGGGVNECVFNSGADFTLSLVDTVLYYPVNASPGTVFFSIGVDTGGCFNIQKSVVYGGTTIAVRLINACILATDGGAGIISQIKTGSVGLALDGGCRVYSDNTSFGIQIGGTTSAAVRMGQGSSLDIASNDGTHGLRDGGGNTGVGIDFVGLNAHANLNAGTNLTGTVADVRMKTAATSTMANVSAAGPISDSFGNVIERA